MSTTRRQLLRSTSAGFGALALADLLHRDATAATKSNPPAVHHTPRAKRVIFIFLEGGPSQVDLWDPKPELVANANQPLSASHVPRKVAEGKAENPDNFGTLTAPISRFRPRGESGLEVSDLMPHLASVADELCVLRAMHADNPAHGPATQQMHTGQQVLPRPSIGSWVHYGLGSENADLPGYVVVSPPAGTSTNCGNAFLPARHQPTVLRDIDAGDDLIRHLSDRRLPRPLRQQQLAFLQRINRRHLAATPEDPRLQGMIEAYELAFRMQTEAPETLSIDGETATTLALYGVDQQPTDRFARQCLIARRLSEAGVRFVQVTASGWDHHDSIGKTLPRSCREVDQPIAALLADLRQRGLLDETLVVISGEFGRTPVSQALSKTKPPGRGHNPFGFTTLLAGGGVRGGYAHGSTDDFGYSAVTGRTHVHDLHATILHLLGLDHERLTHRHAGRDFRLTDVFGHVVEDIIV